MNTQQRLNELGIRLPEVAKPVANYVPTIGLKLADGARLVFISGQVSRDHDSGQMLTGKLGGGVALEEGVRAARCAGLSLLAALQQEVGDLNRVQATLKLTCLVNATPDFTQQPQVANGCSDLMVEVLGDAGTHTRTAFGASGLPGDVTFEVDGIFVARS